MSPQFYYYVGPFGLLGEYVNVSQDVTRVNGAVTRSDTLGIPAPGTLQFSWFLTREEESFKGFTPGSTFEPGKPGRGAWELVARVHELQHRRRGVRGRRRFLRQSRTRRPARRAPAVSA